jgi:hypothetical protein
MLKYKLPALPASDSASVKSAKAVAPLELSGCLVSAGVINVASVATRNEIEQAAAL